MIPPGHAWSMPYYFFNSGLLVYIPRQANLGLAEIYLEWRETASQDLRTGRPGIWFGDWTPEQTAYQVMFAAMTPSPQPLGDDYRIGAPSGPGFWHFLNSNLSKPSTLRRLGDLVAEIQSNGSGPV